MRRVEFGVDIFYEELGREWGEKQLNIRSQVRSNLSALFYSELMISLYQWKVYTVNLVDSHSSISPLIGLVTSSKSHR